MRSGGSSWVMRVRVTPGARVVVSCTGRPSPLAGESLSRWVGFVRSAVGALGTINVVTGTAVLQSMVPNQYLGRVMSLSMMSMGFAQVNGLGMGALAQGIGLETMLPLTGGFIAACMVGLGVAVPRLRRIE